MQRLTQYKSLKLGKIPEEALRQYILKFLGKKRQDVLLPPKYGEDAGIVKLSSNKVVMACDPVTGSRELLGWLSIHINANDIAVCGGEPKWFSACILLPRNATLSDLKMITRQMHEAAKSLGVAIVTGHTEVAPFITSPIVIGHMSGTLISKKIITTSGAMPGDYIIMSKTAGLEGTAILASDFEERLRKRGVPVPTINIAKKYFRHISVVKEALYLARHSGVTSMHDPTEGGIIGGLYELAKASNCGFKVWKEMIPVSKVTAEICRALKIDPLRLISSGVLLATIRNLDMKILRKVGARIIGRITKKTDKLLIDKSGETKIDSPVIDELWHLIDQQ